MDRTKKVKLGSTRAEFYKRKSPGIDRRMLRAHRRSIEWKSFRSDEVNKRRNLGSDLSPLKEITHNQKTTLTKEESRKQQLQKWKEEKELKRKLQSKSKKAPAFKVSKVETEVIPFSKITSLAKVSDAPAPKAPAPQRVTRSRTSVSSSAPAPTTRNTRAAAAKKQPPPSKKQPPALSTSTRSTRGRQAAEKPVTVHPARTTRQTRTSAATVKPNQRVTRGSTTNKTETVKASQPKRGRKPSESKADPIAEEEYGPTPQQSRHVTSRGMDDYALAPPDFVFTAPENLKAFTFNPLSPASAASFLGGTANNFASPVLSRRCSSTPKVGMFSKKSLLHSPAGSTIMESQSSESDSENKPESQSGADCVSDSETKESNSSTPGPVQEIQTECAKPDKSVAFATSEDSDEAETVKKSTRKSVGRRKSVAEAAAAETTAADTYERRKSVRRQSRAASDTIITDEVSQPTEAPTARSTRRKSRSALAVDEEENEGRAATPSRSRRRKSVAVCGMAEQTDIIASPARRKSRKSVAVCGMAEQTDIIASPARRKSRRSVAYTLLHTAGNALEENKDTDSSAKTLEQEKTEMIETDEPTIVDPEEAGEEGEILASEDQKENCEKEKTDVRDEEDMEVEEVESLKELASKSVSESTLYTTACENTVTFEKSEATEMLLPETAPHNMSHPLMGVFQTPASVVRRSARRSHSVGGMTSAARRKKDMRKSFILRGLSPEECVELLKNSPMIEMTRRTPKPVAPAPALDFDDVEELMSSFNSGYDAQNNEEAQNVNTQHATKDRTDPTSENIKETSTEAPTEHSTEGSTNTPAQHTTEGSTDTPTEHTTEANTVTAVSEMGQSPDEGQPMKSGEHDVKYFRNLLVSETDRLNLLSDKWNDINGSTPEIPEEVEGQIRTTVGQAHLLIAQRFKQFSGLVDDCEFKRGEKETTCTDLQGFWDMIYFQVEDVNDKFAALDKLKSKNWQEEKKQVVKKVVKKKAVGEKPKAKPATKSKFAAFRAKMAKQKQEMQEPEQIVIVENKVEKDTKEEAQAAVEESKLSHVEESKLSHVEATSASPIGTMKLVELTPVSSEEVQHMDTQSIEVVTTVGDDFSKYLMPSTVVNTPGISALATPALSRGASVIDCLQTPVVSSDVDMAPAMKKGLQFDQIKVVQSQGRRGSLGRCMSASERRDSMKGRRRSLRSVHFASTVAAPSPLAVKAPDSPFNLDSIVGETRRSSSGRRSTAQKENVLEVYTQASADAASEMMSPATGMARLTMEGSTPPNTDMDLVAGPLFTPPQNGSAPRKLSMTPLVNLMSSSPLIKAPASPSVGSGTPARFKRRSTRFSTSLI